MPSRKRRTSPRRRKVAAQPKVARQSSQAALEELNRRRYLTAANLLEGQGGRLVEYPLEVSKFVVLARRVDMLTLARTQQWVAPLQAAISTIIENGGVPYEVPGDDDTTDPAATLKAATALAIASIVIPPEEYLAGKVKLEEIDPGGLPPMFVPIDFDTGEPLEEPAEGQLILVPPTAEYARLVGRERYVSFHERDLRVIAKWCYVLGPGALGPFRVLSSGPMAPIPSPEGDGQAAE